MNLKPIEEILDRGVPEEIRALFAFTREDPKEEILFKFTLWARFFFPDHFQDKETKQYLKDTEFHKEMDKNNLDVYLGKTKFFVNLAFRGSGKTSRDRDFLAFCIANDEEHYRRYNKVLAKDLKNATQFVTDIYNMLISIKFYYPEIFSKSDLKREETMSSFTTGTGVKVTAGTVGMEHRGDIQEEFRPDFIIFSDIETRMSLRSDVETQAIWDNMHEAISGLSDNGGAIFEGNYLSERGNVHRLIEWQAESKKIMITPIYTREKGSAWPERFPIEKIRKIKKESIDFYGEYLCKPSAGVNVFFDRSTLDNMHPRHPIKTLAGFKIFYPFDPSHRYAGGFDIAGGVGLDSSTSVFIDFSTIPCRVVATYKNNTIKPDIFGDEIARQAELFGSPLLAPENNNHGHATIGRLKQIYDNIFTMEQLTDTAEITPKKSRTYGWSTNAFTKNNMLFALKKAVEDGHLHLSDEDLINELKSYTRDDLMDKERDPRLATRHFDLLQAAGIAWMMRHFAESQKEEEVLSTGQTTHDFEVYK